MCIEHFPTAFTTISHNYIYIYIYIVKFDVRKTVLNTQEQIYIYIVLLALSDECTIQ